MKRFILALTLALIVATMMVAGVAGAALADSFHIKNNQKIVQNSNNSDGTSQNACNASQLALCGGGGFGNGRG